MAFCSSCPVRWQRVTGEHRGPNPADAQRHNFRLSCHFGMPTNISNMTLLNTYSSLHLSKAPIPSHPPPPPLAPSPLALSLIQPLSSSYLAKTCLFHIYTVPSLSRSPCSPMSLTRSLKRTFPWVPCTLCTTSEVIIQMQT